VHPAESTLLESAPTHSNYPPIADEFDRTTPESQADQIFRIRSPFPSQTLPERAIALNESHHSINRFMPKLSKCQTPHRTVICKSLFANANNFHNNFAF
jgi:hypothetical protein